MKIVMICEFFNESLEYQENLLAKYYVKHGHDVTIITSTFDAVFDYYNNRHDAKAPARTYSHDGAKIIKLRYRYNLMYKLRAYMPIKGILEAEKPDLIFVHDIIPNMTEAATYVRKHPRCKMIIDYHADYSNSGKGWISIKILHGLLRRWFLDRARPYTEIIFPIVPAGATFLHEVYGVPHAEMKLMPLGTDLDFAKEVQASNARAELRAELAAGPGEFVIFTGGKFCPLKQTEKLIEAVRQLDRSDIHLVIVGAATTEEESYGAMLKETAAGAPNIHFRGWQDKLGVYRHLAASDMAIFPASQSVLWQQAIGMGLPLAVSERSSLLRGHQDVSYMNMHGNIAILDHQSPLIEQMILLVADLADNPGKREVMAQGARRTAEETLNYDKLVSQTLQYNLAAS